MKVHYTKELLEGIVKDSQSIAEVLRKLGLAPKGGSYTTIRKKLESFKIDTSHFTGQNWRKGKTGKEVSLFKLSDLLKPNINYKSNSLKKRLIEEGIKENKCEECGLEDSAITYELHHINGDHYDNTLTNLKILCPNCHSKTENFRGRNTSREAPDSLKAQRYKDKTCTCLQCGKDFQSDRYDRTRKFCSITCYKAYAGKGTLSERSSSSLANPSLTEENMMKYCEQYKNISEMARSLGFDRGTIREYLHKYNLYDSFMAKKLK